MMWMLFGRKGIAYAAADAGAGAGAAAAPSGAAAASDAGAGGDAAASGAGAGAAADTGASAADAAGDAGGKTGDDAGAGDAAVVEPDYTKDYVEDATKTPEENNDLKKAFEGEKKRRADAAPLFGKVDKYADIQVPDGMQLDQDAANQLHDMARTLGLSQQGVDSIISIQKGIYERMAAKSTEDFNATLKDWNKQLRADPLVGGAKFDEHIATSKKFLNAFADEETRKWLDDTKLSEHPGLVRLFFLAGEAMGEGTALGGGKTGQSGDVADILYNAPKAK